MKIRSEFSLPGRSYAGHITDIAPDVLDCSMGENPYGFSPVAGDALMSFDVARLAHYPHDRSAIEAIVNHWKAYSAFAAENLIMTEGSIGAIYLLNKLFTHGSKVVGLNPTFTDTTGDCIMAGLNFCGIPMENDDFFARIESIEAAIDDATAYVYVVNPHNPTGQTFPVSGLERLAVRAGRANAILVVDEAYGDFISQRESALTVWHKYDNVIVIRSFSKGFGLSGLRVGYLVAPESIVRCLAKVSNPYMVNEPSRAVIAAALKDPNWPLEHMNDFVSMKRELVACTGHNLTVLPTDERVPVCTLRHRDPTVDLQRLLYDAGVMTVSGAEFDTLNASFVRLRIPQIRDAERLFRAVRAVDLG